MAILELRAARGWTAAQTARSFFVEPATVSSWMRRLSDEGRSALVQIREPANKFPDFVGVVVRRLKALCPAMGKKRLAQTLARAGLHLSATTVGRMLAKKDDDPIDITPADGPLPAGCDNNSARSVAARRPDHIWHVDLTIIPTTAGMWTAWLPFAQFQVWPFCWWVAAVLDHYSRGVVALKVFRKPPSSPEICAVLDQAISRSQAKPRYIITDKGSQFRPARSIIFSTRCRKSCSKPERLTFGRT